MAYRIYTVVNLAETSRDADDVRTQDLCYKEKEEDAVAFCEKYIEDKFTQKDTELEKDGENYSAHDSCSWGTTLKADKIKIE